MSVFQVFKKTTEPRLPKVIRAMEILLNQQRSADFDRDRNLDWEYDHMNACVRYVKAIAHCRKIDPDLAACAVAVQNIGRVVAGTTSGHAEAGYEPARRLFSELGCFTPKEIEQLTAAVRNHSRKDRVDGVLDELAKDVDVYVRFTKGSELSSYDMPRLKRVQTEMQQSRK